jgi:hypothetical protein
MIENHPDARPPAGLSRARLVYEAEAEGGITRFLAVFTGGENIPKIGPVRSARPYYVDWAEELKALYVHCGGSPAALAKIYADKVKDFNEYYNGSYFWRDSGRGAPHNLYTSSEKILGYLSMNPAASAGRLPAAWKFKDDAGPEFRPESASITAHYKGNDFTVLWKYDKMANDYERFEGGAVHADEDGSAIRAKNIIIQSVKSAVIDEEGRREIGNIGSGKALVCIDGRCDSGTWVKKSKGERTVFYGSDGAEAAFNAGTSWIEIMPIGYSADIK